MTTTSRKITACMFIVIVLGLGVLSLRSFADYGATRELDPVNGELARDVESHYDDEFPARDLGNNLWAAINYTLFKEGRPGVTVGEDGWLFTDEELFAASEEPEVVQTNMQRVAAIADHLRAKGIPLALLVVPSKVRLYADKLGGHRVQPVMQSLYSRFLERMALEKMLVPNLLPALAEARDKGTQVFLRTDTHWTPKGADVFAAHAARKLKSVFNRQPWGDTRFSTSLGEARIHEGDLLNYLPFEPLFPSMGPDPDRFRERSTSAVRDGKATATSLFAETSADVVLVGTSYSANPLWNFPGALKDHLGRDLINVSDEGHGPFKPMTDYLRSDEFRSHSPEFVIWEFPERYLAQPVSSEDTLAWFDRQKNRLALTEVAGHTSTQ